MIDPAIGPTPPTPAKVSRVWRVVLIVVAVQAALVLFGTVAFSALGFNDQTGGCGGG